MSDHILRTQILVIPDSTFQHGSSFTVFQKKKIRSDHLKYIGRYIRKAGPSTCGKLFCRPQMLAGDRLSFGLEEAIGLLSRWISKEFYP